MVLSLLALLLPLWIMRCRNRKWVQSIGTIGLSYLFGIVTALLVGALSAIGLFSPPDTAALEIVSYVAIALAIPLLLFSNDIKLLMKLSKKTLLSFLLLALSVLLVSGGLFAVFTKDLAGGSILSGMAVALYTGGTPNLNAVAMFFGLPNELILTANMSDIIFGGVFYAFLIFLAKPLVGKVLPTDRAEIAEINEVLYSEDTGVRFHIKSKPMLRNLLLSFGITVVSLLIGLGIWILRGQVDGTLTNYVVPALMIGTTVGGIVFSFRPKIRQVPENPILGQYFACVFSYSISSMIRLDSFGTLSVQIFAVFAIITTLTFAVHMLLCKLFNINADIMITSATAGIYGPAFIPSVTRGIQAEYMLSSGLILGAFGYSIATFLGIAFTRLLMLFV